MKILSACWQLSVLLLTPINRPGTPTAYVTDFKASRMLIDAYDKLLSRPRQLTVNRKVHSEDLPELIQASRKLLNKLDSLVNLFDGTEFEAAYHNARRIVNSGSRKAPATEETPSTNWCRKNPSFQDDRITRERLHKNSFAWMHEMIRR